MTVQFYQFGKLVGGATPSGGAVIPDEASYGEPEQISGTLPAGITTITFTRSTKHVTVRNTHDSASLQYSFDNVTWFTAIAYQVIQEPVSAAQMWLQPVGVTNPTYEITAALMA